jgi:hypothetical protein
MNNINALSKIFSMNYSCGRSEHKEDENSLYFPLNQNSHSNKSRTTKWYGAITDQSIVRTDVENIFTPENSRNQETNNSEQNKGKSY